MKTRNVMPKIEIAPKPLPPKTSWWTAGTDRATWVQQAAKEHPRMNGSPQAQLVRPHILSE